MKPTQKTLGPLVARWVEEHLITEEQADLILSKYPAEARSAATVTFSVIGGLLCILGMVLLISANWQTIPREVKLGGVLILLAVATLVGVESNKRKWHPAISEISYLFAAVLPLASLVLIGQFFNLGASMFSLMFWWFASILLLPFLSLSTASFVVWWSCLCALIGFGIQEEIPGLFFWLGNRAQSASAIFGLFGIATVAGSQLWTRWGQISQRAWGESLGLITTSLALFIYDFDIFDGQRRFATWEVLWGAVFLLNLAAVFVGYKTDRRHLVTLGLVMQGVTILSFYLRLAGSLLSTGTLFLSSGTLLLVLILVLRRVRRTILK
jgi:uncharacterized membrane protein